MITESKVLENKYFYISVFSTELQKDEIVAKDTDAVLNFNAKDNESSKSFKKKNIKTLSILRGCSGLPTISWKCIVKELNSQNTAPFK